jgi:hypothetical protein
MKDPDNVMSKYERHRRARAKLSQANKRIVFDALAAANITLVHVEFDGEGDSGQIESVIALRGDERAELPATTVTIQQVAWAETKASTKQATLEDAIESLCYDFLEETHDGWENNDGAYGDFRLDVATRTIELEFNGRFTDTCTSNHTF